MVRNSLKVVLLGLVIIGGLAWHLVSPLYSMSQLREAALAGDEAELTERVDFPALRESLKSELRARLEAEAERGAMSNDPFAAMGSALVMGMIEPMVDTIVSAKGIKSLVAFGQFDTRGGRSGQDKLKWTIERDSFDRVLASPSAGSGDEGLSLVFDRDGLGWKLVGVDLTPETPAE